MTWHSAAFDGAKQHVHSSGHWGASIKKWPVHAITAWLKTFQQADASSAASAVAPPVLARMPSARSAMMVQPPFEAGTTTSFVAAAALAPNLHAEDGGPGFVLALLRARLCPPSPRSSRVRHRSPESGP